MKRICFFAGNIDLGGGTERSLTLVANELVERGHDVTIVSLWGGTRPFFAVSSSVKIASLFPTRISFAKSYVKVLYRLRRYIEANRFDVLVSVESSQSLYALPSCLGLGITQVNWEHFNAKVDLGFFPRRIARYFAAKFSHQIVVLTERDNALWREKFGVKGCISTIPNAIPFSDVKYSDAQEKIVLAVGRFTYQKGFDLLLNAWRLSAQHLDGWQLWIVGDGEDREKLEATVEEYDLSQSVVLHGPTSTIADYYCRAKWFCLSSRFEGLPMVLLEASSWGLPIVAFDCDTGPAEIVTHGENGLLCAAEDAAALSAALRSAISIDNAKYREMQIKARATADRFTLRRIGDMWMNLLEKT